MSDLAPRVFDFVGDYVAEVEAAETLLEEFQEDEGLVLFCREFFNQFLAAEFAVQIDQFSTRTATDAWVEIKPQLTADDDPRTPIVAAFREFCQDYDTIIGEHYDKGGELSAFQEEFVPELLDSIVAWADDGELGEAASSAQAELNEVLKIVKAAR